MRTLQQRGYIDEIGKDPGPGQAILFGTTKLFLEKLGLDSLDDLPALRDFVPHADVVEQLERGLRPDREALSPEGLLNGNGSDSVEDLLDSDVDSAMDEVDMVAAGLIDEADDSEADDSEADADAEPDERA
jgi:segregation and condensation protein B